MMQKLFDHMEQDHGLILTESELQDIVSAVGMDVRLLLDRLEKSRDEWRTIAGKFRAVLGAGSGAREDLACEEYDRMIKTMNPTTTVEKATAEHEAEMRASTPRTDKATGALVGFHREAAEIVSADFARELERDLIRTEAALDEATGAFHTCHDKCQRPLCVMRRELAAVQAEQDQHQITIVALRNQGDVSERGWKRVERERDAANAELERVRDKLAETEKERDLAISALEHSPYATLAKALLEGFDLQCLPMQTARFAVEKYDDLRAALAVAREGLERLRDYPGTDDAGGCLWHMAQIAIGILSQLPAETGDVQPEARANVGLIDAVLQRLEPLNIPTGSAGQPGEGKGGVLEFANAILHGDVEHRAWLTEAAQAFVAGQPLPPVRSATTPPTTGSLPIQTDSVSAPQGGDDATVETDAMRQIPRLFEYLDYSRSDAPRNSINPYHHEAAYEFQDLRDIRDHAKRLETQRNEARRAVAERDAELAELRRQIAGLSDPVAVRTNILRGNIALPENYVERGTDSDNRIMDARIARAFEMLSKHEPPDPMLDARAAKQLPVLKEHLRAVAAKLRQPDAN